MTKVAEIKTEEIDGELDEAFLEAVHKVNIYLDPFPADFLLRLYAYYKKATNNNPASSSQSKTIIDAFKANALLQVTNVSQTEAKQKYIELVNDYFL